MASQEHEDLDFIDSIEVLEESNQSSITESTHFKRKRTRSTVWRYFSRSETKEGESKCTICAEIVKHRSNTTNLLKVCKTIYVKKFEI